MADIHAATSTYDSGTNDTYTPVADNTDDVLDDHQNGPASAIIAIETILGAGTTLKGSAADLVARLAVALEANGKIKDLSATTKTTFPPTTDEGCAGDVTANFTASQLLRKHASLSKFETTGYTVPGSSGVMVSEADTQTLTNKTLTTPTLSVPVVADFTSATHDHSNAANGGALASNIVILGTVKTTDQSYTTSTYSGTDVTSFTFTVTGTRVSGFTTEHSVGSVNGKGTLTQISAASSGTGAEEKWEYANDGTGVSSGLTTTIRWKTIDTSL